ncbi:MAG TPA: DUF4241 domain-containing protein [Chloroflexia bacterium]|jgi:hypothetical protein
MPAIKRIASAGKEYTTRPELLTPDPKAMLEWVQLGEIVLPTGALVACDPLVTPRRAPFPAHLPAGTYPVWLARDTDDRDAACVLLRLSENAPVRWEQALLPNKDPARLEPDQRWGYPVDSGVGSFMDAQTAQQVAERPATGKAILSDVLKRIAPSYANVLVDETTGANVIAFATQGDGVFSTYFGFDAGGGIVSVLTDINLFEEAEEDAASTSS